MIHFVGTYEVDGTTKSSIDELLSYIRGKKTIYIDTETRRLGRSHLSYDVLDTEVVMLQIGDGYHQWVIDCRNTKIPRKL